METGARILPARRAFEKMDLPRLAVIDALKLEAIADRPIDRKGADAEHALQFVQQRQRLARGAVAFVHEGENRHAALPAHFEQFERLRLDPLARVNHHDHGIHGRQHAVSVLGKILMAGSVQQIDAVAVVIELQHGRADGNAALALQFHPVRSGGALIFAGRDRAGQLHRAAVKQELLRQRRFAGVRMRDDGECAPLLDFLGNLHKSPKDSTDLAKDKGA